MLVGLVTLLWLVWLIAYLCALIAHREDETEFFWVFGGISLLATIVCGGWALSRRYSIRRCLPEGIKVSGRVLSVHRNVVNAMKFGARSWNTASTRGSTG